MNICCENCKNYIPIPQNDSCCSIKYINIYVHKGVYSCSDYEDLIPHDHDSGLTEKEQSIMRLIIIAYEEFSKLEKQHLSELQDFINHIHGLQSILAMRITRRDYPKYWIK